MRLPLAWCAVILTIPAPRFPPVRDRKTGKLKPVGPFIAICIFPRKSLDNLLKLERPRRVLDIPTGA